MRTVSLPASLNGARRAALHRLAEAGGLQHVSLGQPPARRLLLATAGATDAAALEEVLAEAAAEADAGGSEPPWARGPVASPPSESSRAFL